MELGSTPLSPMFPVTYPPYQFIIKILDFCLDNWATILTQDLTKNYTLEELSARFDIALTPMKNCFKSVYGSPIFTYKRNYRMNYAASLLKSDK